MNGSEDLVRLAGRAAIGGGVLALSAVVTVFAIEGAMGEDAMGSTGALYAGWASFVAAGLLVVGLLGVAARYAGVLSAAGRAALLVLGFATAMTAGAMSTLALVVPDLVDRARDIADNPPAAVPATFILSGLVSGICALVLAIGLRRSGAAPKAATTLLIVGAVLCMVPLPSRFFLLSFAVGMLALAPAASRADATVSEPHPV
jgi:hypothetical protein